jgi:hypothetical protein
VMETGGFAHIKYIPRGIAHKVNAGALRQPVQLLFYQADHLGSLNTTHNLF